MASEPSSIAASGNCHLPDVRRLAPGARRCVLGVVAVAARHRSPVIAHSGKDVPTVFTAIVDERRLAGLPDDPRSKAATFRAGWLRLLGAIHERLHVQDRCLFCHHKYFSVPCLHASACSVQEHSRNQKRQTPRNAQPHPHRPLFGTPGRNSVSPRSARRRSNETAPLGAISHFPNSSGAIRQISHLRLLNRIPTASGPGGFPGHVRTRSATFGPLITHSPEAEP